MCVLIYRSPDYIVVSYGVIDTSKLVCESPPAHHYSSVAIPPDQSDMALETLGQPELQSGR